MFFAPGPVVSLICGPRDPPPSLAHFADLVRDWHGFTARGAPPGPSYSSRPSLPRTSSTQPRPQTLCAGPTPARSGRPCPLAPGTTSPPHPHLRLDRRTRSAKSCRTTPSRAVRVGKETTRRAGRRTRARGGSRPSRSGRRAALQAPVPEQRTQPARRAL